MFLKEVYRYSKGLFALMAGFALFQLICFYKHGMVFSPWYNYGMYSGKTSIQPNYEVYALPGKYSADVRWLMPQRDDRVYNAMIWYHYQEKNNRFVRNNVLAIAGKFGWQPDTLKFISRLDETAFRSWFYNYASGWVILPDSTLYDFKPKIAHWNGHILELTREVTP